MSDESSNKGEKLQPKRSLEEILNNPSQTKELLDVDVLAARFGGYDDE